jgi:hypothetical protein
MSVTPLNLMNEFDMEELTSKFALLSVKDKKRKWTDTDMCAEENMPVEEEVVVQNPQIVDYVNRYIVIENDDLEEGEIWEGEREDVEEDTRMNVVEDDEEDNHVNVVEDDEEDNHVNVVEDDVEHRYFVEMEDSGPLKLSDLYV